MKEIDKTKSHHRVHAGVGVLVELMGLVGESSRKVAL
jgi:hypothetical protein